MYKQTVDMIIIHHFSSEKCRNMKSETGKWYEEQEEG